MNKSKGKESYTGSRKLVLPTKDLYSKSGETSQRSNSPMNISEEEIPFTQISHRRVQNEQTKTPERIDSYQFGNVSLQICQNPATKFRTGTEVTQKQQCLLDNLWHIKTVSQATAFKVQVLNALSFYFNEQKTILPEQKKKISHYVIYRGTKTGLFNNFNTVRQHIMCSNPIYKGYYTFHEAMNNARNSLGINFFIEPEEVKSFADMAKDDPSNFIKTQENRIRDLENQIFEFHKKDYEQKAQIEQLKKENTEKINEISSLKKNLFSLENHIPNRTFDNFRARIIDLPMTEVMGQVFDKIPDLENVINEKILHEFPDLLINLQKEIVDIHFTKTKGTKVIQRPGIGIPVKLSETDCKIFINDELPMIPGLFLLQIDLNQTDLKEEKILQYYHNGMIDFIEFSYTDKVDTLVEKFGEKFFLTAANIATMAQEEKVYCKISASLPEIIMKSYRPARKIILMTDQKDEERFLRGFSALRPYDFEYLTNIGKIKHFQKSCYIENPYLHNYKMVAEGHYVKVFVTKNWVIDLPFSGEGEQLKADYNFINLHHDPEAAKRKALLEGSIDYEDSQSMDETIPETHRDL